MDWKTRTTALLGKCQTALVFFLHPMLLAGLYSCFTFIFIKFAQYIDVNKNHVRRMGDKTIKTSEL